MDDELRQEIESLKAQVESLTSDRIPKVDRASKRRDKRQVFAGFGLFAVAVMIAGTMSASALSGSNTVDSGDIVDGSITSSDIKSDAILGSRVRNNSLTGADINESTLDLPNGGGGTPDDNSVTSAKILDGTISTADLTNNLITVTKIATGAVTGDRILNGAVALADLAANSVDSSKIVDGSVTTSDILTGTILGEDLSSGSVSGAKILDNTIASNDVADGSITLDDIADSAEPAGGLVVPGIQVPEGSYILNGIASVTSGTSKADVVCGVTVSPENSSQATINSNRVDMAPGVETGVSFNGILLVLTGKVVTLNVSCPSGVTVFAPSFTLIRVTHGLS